MVTNEVKTSMTMIALGLGKEYRRGSTRLQGLYGAEAMIMPQEENFATYGNLLNPKRMLKRTFRSTEVKAEGHLVLY